MEAIISMSGYCPDCGNQQCICEEIGRRNNTIYREEFQKEKCSKCKKAHNNVICLKCENNWLKSKLTRKDKEISATDQNNYIWDVAFEAGKRSAEAGKDK